MVVLKRSAILMVSVLMSTLVLFADVRVSNIYEVEIPIENPTPEARGQATAKALLIVLVRISGKQNIETEDAIAEALKAPQQYRVSAREFSKSINGETKLILSVKFNATRINSLLARADLPIWSDRRPSTLVWVAIEDGRNRYILGSGSTQTNKTTVSVKAEITRLAKERGVPVLFPLMDLQDQKSLRYSDIIGGFHDSIKKASARYGADTILVGKVRHRGPDSWRAQWTIITSDRTKFIESSRQPLSQVVASGVHGLANYLASHVSTNSPVVVDTSEPRLKVAVSNINTMTDYASVVDYVSKLSSVRTVQVVDVNESTITLAVDLKSSVSSFKQSVSENPKLKVAEDDDAPMVISQDSPNNNDSSNATSAQNEALKYRYTP